MGVLPFTLRFLIHYKFTFVCGVNCYYSLSFLYSFQWHNHNIWRPYPFSTSLIDSRVTNGACGRSGRRMAGAGIHSCKEVFLSSLFCSSAPESPYLENCSLMIISNIQFSSVQALSRVRLFATPWIAARQASLSITNSRSSLRLTSIESVMPSSHLVLCRPLLLLPPIPPSIRVFSNESTLRMRWPEYWSFSFGYQ